ncbi:FAD-binding oxidoreductase [bacterium]|nr:FAD-binding oxidoreductase [bacterium]
MKTSTSPWLHQLDHERPITKLREDIATDVAVVGAGIAGISTAFFLLKNTDKRIVILEKFRLAHGATGHNAGQVVSYFERSFASMTKEFGLKMAGEGCGAIDGAWELIDQMYTEAGLNIPFSRFTGHVGFSSALQLMNFLEDARLRKRAGLIIEECFVAHDAPFIGSIPAAFAGLYTTVPRGDILARLETVNDSFVACISHQKGTINSALFCQEVLAYLLKKYSDRFHIYEETLIGKVVLKKDHAILDAIDHTVTASRVVLCTNGFENVTILNESGLDIDVKFHHDVIGVVGYMSGYLEKYNKPPAAISYFTDPDQSMEDPYFYLTRRLYEYDKNDKGTSHNLICVGGPEIDLDDRREYIPDYDYPEKAHQDIDQFIKETVLPGKNQEKDGKKDIDYKFTWHGLMGYTPNMIRRIGFEPKNPVLLYNLGCNGTGILPSVYGGDRISRLIKGDKLAPSIFDPK